MKNIISRTQDNGYKAAEVQGMIGRFEKAAALLFPGCTVNHFYYGDRIDMASISLGNHHYAHFNVTANRVSLCGWTCSFDEYEKFGSMTHNDELYPGRLLEIAG